MAGARWSGGRAGAAGWVLAGAVAVAAFGAGPRLLLVSQVRGAFLSLFVLYIIWAAIALYRVVEAADGLEKIADAVASLTPDRALQVAILAWAFASFLQGVTGFGVPVAVVAPLMVGLGFAPLASVVAASIGHAWAVTFGSVASSFYAMLAVTSLEPEAIAGPSAIVLGLAGLACGLVALRVAAPDAPLRRVLPLVAVVGGTMALAHWWVATSPLWPLASFLAGLAGLIVAGVWGLAVRARSDARQPLPFRRTVRGGMAYVLLLAVVMLAELVRPVHAALNRWALTVDLPATATEFGWTNPAGPAREISLFGHAGALILVATALAYVYHRRVGDLAPGAWRRIVRHTAQDALRPTAAVFALVGMGVILSESGMTAVLAQGAASASGSAFPVVAPVIGALGAFMTGSNTNSNVVFAPLQLETARLLNLDGAWVLAGQNLGGAVGSVFAPAKVIVAASTVGLATGGEGLVLRRNLVLGGAIVLLGGLGLLVFLAAGQAPP